MGYPPAEIGVEAMRRLVAYQVVDIQRGLRDHEFDMVGARYGFTFADDHRAFLEGGLPTGPGWPDWRAPDQRAVRDQLAWPVEGLLFDVEHKGFWHRAWGECPDDPLAALAVAGAALLRAPQMVPLRGNRYLPAGAGTSVHPILQMFRSDVHTFGADLADWVVQEFAVTAAPEKASEVTVEFWGDLL
ncbi:MAG TPA: hypothetical protein VHV82_07090 [Sporichthyaceae bacterium]|nr:hypothetical protein [Sporichthyaceae bacterium]